MSGKKVNTEILSRQGENLAEYKSCEKIPPALKWWIGEYDSEERTAVPKQMPFKAPRDSASIIVEPLLGNIEWGQKAPFWDNLKFPHPTKANTRVYCCTGCVATAIAQVVYYLARKGFRRGCRATKAYTTSKYKYSVAALPSVAMFDWSYMTEQTPKTKHGKKAVAQLMEYCGKASKADYGYSSTSAPMANVVPTLRDFFGLGDGGLIVYKYAFQQAGYDAVIFDLEGNVALTDDDIHRLLVVAEQLFPFEHI